MLGENIGYAVDAAGQPRVWHERATGSPRPVPTLEEYGYVWTSLGTPPDSLFSIPEYHEADRRNLNAGSIGVHVSAPRAVENFLDMGHFPFVHGGLLGQMPHTEVAEYDVEIEEATNEIYARNCVFFQPLAAATASGGQMSSYVYRVPHPHCVMLYKSCPVDEQRFDVIALFLQATSAESVRAHNLLSVIDSENSLSLLRRFQQHIFGQDKPILENQRPKRLPLDTRAETPIRADKSAIAYRRWLSELGVTYSTIPAK